MNSDGTKLSKRQNHLHLSALRERGILPPALLNFVTLVGGGFQDKEYSLNQLFSMEELAERFQLDRIHTASCKIELDRLAALNQVALRAVLRTVAGRREMVRVLKDLLANCDVDRQQDLLLTDDERLERVLLWAQDRVTSVQQLTDSEYRYLWRFPRQLDGTVSLTPHQLEQVKEVLRTLKSLAEFPIKIKQLCKSSGCRYPEVMKDLRLLLSGRSEGPPVTEMLDILETEEAILRIDNYLKSLAGES
jgi:glutamyl/glutaminyl-tRNA synthetase